MPALSNQGRLKSMNPHFSDGLRQIGLALPMLRSIQKNGGETLF
ncbi:hypothetical protein [Neisseria dumasiana]|nr:hypothetical protein [Neisseria dumasiana]